MIKTALKIFFIFLIVGASLYIYTQVSTKKDKNNSSDNIEQEQSSTEDAAKGAGFSVEVMSSSHINGFVDKNFFGTIEPVNTNLVYAQINSRVSESFFKEGDNVEKKALLFDLQTDDRKARLRSAKAIVNQRSSEYTRIKKLVAKGYESSASRNQAYALLEQARAELDKANVEIKQTKVYAPISGVLQKKHVEVGEYFSKGALLASIVDDTSYKIEFYVPQAHVPLFKIGTEVKLKSIKLEVPAQISYISTIGEPNTKNFLIEAKIIGNPPENLFFGQDVEVLVGIERKNMHYLPSSSLALSSEGDIGIKHIDNKGIVRFHEATIVDEDDEGYYLAGLPNDITVVTQGQGFVEIGQEINISN